MATLDAITGESAVISLLNRQDAQQKVQKAEDQNQGSLQEVSNPSKAQQLFGPELRGGEQAAPAALGNVADKEPDSDKDDRGNVTETRGQNVNLLA